MEGDLQYRKEQCVSGMYPHCQFCSHTCADRYNDFLDKGVNMQFIPTEKDAPVATILHFYKEDEKWYADVKSHTKEENEMVCGTELILDMFANGKDHVMLFISSKRLKEDEQAEIELKIAEHDDDGAWYTVSGTMYDEAVKENQFIKELGNQVWICNVTHTVLGEHPDELYIYYAKKIARVVE